MFLSRTLGLYASPSRAALFALALALCSYAQTKTDFSGNWKLNVAKSDFGQMPPPDSRSDAVEQSEGLIKDTVTSSGQQGNVTYTLLLKTDGTESTVNAAGRDLHVSATWDGPALVETIKLDYEGNAVNIKSNWTLSPDGNTWTQAAHIASPMGEMDQKLVFEKQSGSAATGNATAGMPPRTTPPAAMPPSTMPPSTPAAGDKPNFSGVWKLNVAKSDFGPLPGPESETETIEQTSPDALNLAVAQVGQQGNRNYELALNINGKEEAHKMGDQEVKTTSHWEGRDLVVLTKLMYQDNEILIAATYSMAPGGKTVNVATHLSSPMGEADQKMVFDKQ